MGPILSRFLFKCHTWPLSLQIWFICQESLRITFLSGFLNMTIFFNNWLLLKTFDQILILLPIFENDTTNLRLIDLYLALCDNVLPIRKPTHLIDPLHMQCIRRNLWLLLRLLHIRIEQILVLETLKLQQELNFGNCFAVGLRAASLSSIIIFRVRRG